MAATEGMSPLTKVDSAISGLGTSPVDDKKSGFKHRRSSSSVSDAHRIEDLEARGEDLNIAPETQKLGWKLNTSPNTVEDKDMLKKPLCLPLVKKIDLRFPLGLEVTARNMKGVTIKDALDAIHKQFKKKADDELDGKPYLAGFEWDRDECYTRFIVHQKAHAEAPQASTKSKKKKNQQADEKSPLDV